MFLNKIRHYFSKVSIRIAIIYSFLFSLCFILALGIIYVQVSGYLKNKDRYVLEIRANQINELLSTPNNSEIKLALNNFKEQNLLKNMLVEILDSKNVEIFKHLPEEATKFEIDKIINLILSNSSKVDSKKWHYLRINDGEESNYEVKLYRLKSGAILAIGESSDDRDDLLENIQKKMVMVLIPSLFAFIYISLLLSKKILKPIEQLEKSIKNVRHGDLTSRVEESFFNDELKYLSNAYNEMLDQIQNLIKINNETVDNIAHDLKTPITQSRMSSEIALQSKDFEKLKKSAERNIESCDDILKLIHSVLMISRLDSKSFTISYSINDIKKIIDDILDIYSMVAEEKNIKIINDVEKYDIKIDQVLFKQALINLIDNAIKYSHYDSVIELSSIQEEEYFIILIKDSGIGIGESEVGKIWNRLYRCEKSRHLEGNGIGLAIVKSIVSAHKGIVKVDSVLGKGSTFKVFLPTSNITGL